MNNTVLAGMLFCFEKFEKHRTNFDIIVVPSIYVPVVGTFRHGHSQVGCLTAGTCWLETAVTRIMCYPAAVRSYCI